MLGDRQQLEVREAELLGVAREPRRDLAVAQRPVPLLGHARPRAEMHLVDRERLAPRVAACAPGEPARVAPGEARLEHARSRGGRDLHRGGEWIGLEQEVTIGRQDLELVERAGRDARDEQLEDAGAARPAHRKATPVPIAEVADHGDALRARRPDGKANARDTLLLAGARAEHLPQAAVGAFAEQMQVELAQRRRESIGIVALEMRRRRRSGSAVDRRGGPPGPGPRTSPGGRSPRAPGAAVLEQHLGCDRIGLEHAQHAARDASDHARVSAEHALRLAQTALDETRRGFRVADHSRGRPRRSHVSEGSSAAPEGEQRERARGHQHAAVRAQLGAGGREQLLEAARFRHRREPKVAVHAGGVEQQQQRVARDRAPELVFARRGPRPRSACRAGGISGSRQSSAPSSPPSGRSQVRSFARPPATGRPVKKLRRRSTGCARRSAKTRRVKASSSRPAASGSQSTQVSGLSWQ